MAESGGGATGFWCCHGGSSLCGGDGGAAGLRALAGSSDRAEADRGRAVLLSLQGWSSVRIAEAFSVEPDSVRDWRWTFGREGVAGLRARKAPGPEPVKARAALSVHRLSRGHR